MRKFKSKQGAGSGTPVLSALSLSSNSITENSTAGTVVGNILNKTPGSTLSLFVDAGARFAISGTQLVAGATSTDYETATSHSITIRETLAGAIGSPKDTVMTINVINVLEVTLAALGGTFTFPENSTAGTVAGAITGISSGSTLSLFDNAGNRVALSGTNIVAGSVSTDYETATSHSFTIRETHPDGNNSPRDTVCTLAVTNVFEQPNLAALAFSASTFTVGTSSSGSINNATTGSTITASGLPAGLTIDGTNRTWAWSGSGSTGTGTFTLTETLADSANSPRNTTISYTISSSGSFNPATLFSGGQNGIWLENDITTMFTDTAGTTQCTTAGDLIACWKDKSGNNHHFTQATSGNRPTLQQNANGKWYASFSGSSSLSSGSYQINNSTDGTFSTGAAANNTSTFVGSPRIWSSENTSGGGMGSLRSTAAGTMQMNQVAGGSLSDSGGGTLSLSTDFYITGINNASVLEVWSNGTSNGSTTGTTIKHPNQPVILGASNGSGTLANFLTGRIYGVLITDDAWSSTNRTGVEGYLNALFTVAADTTPDAFAFTDVSNVAVSTMQTSNSITVTGINAPSSVTITGGEWEKNASGTWLASGGTVVLNDTVRVRAMSSSSNSATVNTTLNIGGVSDTFSSTTIAAAAGPTLTQTSAAGTAPLTLSWTDPNNGQGCFIHWEISPSLTPALNVDGTYVTVSQYGVQFVDGESYANLDLALGYSTPNGAFSMHARPMIDDPNGTTTINDPFTGVANTYTAYAWSNAISDTINVSTAQLVPTTGFNKSRYVNVSTGNLQMIHNNTSVGLPCGVRADHAAINTKFHIEITIDGLRGSGIMGLGFDDGTRPDCNTAVSPYTGAGFINGAGYPGNTNGTTTNPGFFATMTSGSSAITLYRNGGSGGFTFGSVPAQGDKLIFEVDTVANTIAVYSKTVGNAAVLRGTVTLTSSIPSAWYFLGAGGRGDGTNALFGSSDAFTVNFGGSAYDMTPNTGFNNFYA